jgi:hypothetical protein
MNNISNFIQQARTQGFSSNAILGFLSNTNKKVGNFAYQANSARYTADTILHYVEKVFGNEENDEQFQTHEEKTRKQDKKNKSQANKNLANTALAAANVALAGYGLARFAGQAGKYGTNAVAGTQRLLGGPATRPRLPGTGPRTPPPSPRGQALALPAPGRQAPPPQTPGPRTPPPAAPIAPRGTPLAPIAPPSAPPSINRLGGSQVATLVKNLKIENQLDTLLRNGFDVATASSALKALVPKQTYDILKQQPGGVENIVESYFNEAQARPPEESFAERVKRESANGVIGTAPPQTEAASDADTITSDDFLPQASQGDIKQKTKEVSLESYKPSGNDYTLSKEYIGKWYSSKPGSFVGNLKDFFTGEELRKRFKDVLDVKIYKGSPDYRTKGGKEADAGYGQGIILLNSFDDKSIFPLLVEEASHALQDRKGRLTGSSEDNYEENINEISAKKHVDYLNNFYEKENEINREKQKQYEQKRIEESLSKVSLNKVEKNYQPIVNIKQKTQGATFGREPIKKLSEFPALEKSRFAVAAYKEPGESPEEFVQRKRLQTAVNKTAKSLTAREDFLNQLVKIPIEKHVGVMQTTQDLIKFMAGIPNVYDVLLTDEEREDLTKTFLRGDYGQSLRDEDDVHGAYLDQGQVWNLILQHDPNVNQYRPQSMKKIGALKSGKMSAAEFGRYVSHAVYDVVQGKKISTDLSDKINKISKAAEMTDSLVEAMKEGRLKVAQKEMEKMMDDEYFLSLFEKELDELLMTPEQAEKTRQLQEEDAKMAASIKASMTRKKNKIKKKDEN